MVARESKRKLTQRVIFMTGLILTRKRSMSARLWPSRKEQRMMNNGKTESVR